MSEPSNAYDEIIYNTFLFFKKDNIGCSASVTRKTLKMISSLTKLSVYEIASAVQRHVRNTVGAKKLDILDKCILKKQLHEDSEIISLKHVELSYCSSGWIKEEIMDLLNEIKIKIIWKYNKNLVVEHSKTLRLRRQYLKKIAIAKKMVYYAGETMLENVYECSTTQQPHLGVFALLSPIEGMSATSVVTAKDRQKLEEKELFYCWLKEEVLPSLKGECMIVMNNGMNNLDLNKADGSYENMEVPDAAIDSLIKAAGHEVLRIPCPHYDLNPIYYIWSNMKKDKQFISQLKTVEETEHSNKIEAYFDGAMLTEAVDAVEKVTTFYNKYYRNYNNAREKFIKKLIHEADSSDEEIDD